MGIPGLEHLAYLLPFSSGGVELKDFIKFPEYMEDAALIFISKNFVSNTFDTFNISD